MRKTVVVTGEENTVIKLAAQIRKLGTEVISVPTIRLSALRLSPSEQKAIDEFDSYEYVLFTSAHAVRFFKANLTERRHYADVRILAVGPATARACSEIGLSPEIVSKEFNAVEMAHGIEKLNGMRILFPRAALSGDEVIDYLRARGALVTIVSLYTTHDARILASTQLHVVPDFLIFMSGSSVRSFSSQLGKQLHGMLKVPVIVIGEQTAQACRNAGFSKIIVAQVATSEGIVKTLQQQL